MIYEVGNNIALLFDDIQKLAKKALPDKSDDLTQEVALRLWSSRVRLPKRFHLNYLKKIVSNTACDLLRKESKQRRWLVDYFVNEDGSVSSSHSELQRFYISEPALDYCDNSIRVDLIQSAIDKLSPEQKEVIELRVAGLSCMAIAEKQAVPEVTVRTRLHYARKHLVKYIGGIHD